MGRGEDLGVVVGGRGVAVFEGVAGAIVDAVGVGVVVGEIVGGVEELVLGPSSARPVARAAASVTLIGMGEYTLGEVGVVGVVAVLGASEERDEVVGGVVIIDVVVAAG